MIDAHALARLASLIVVASLPACEEVCADCQEEKCAEVIADCNGDEDCKCVNKCVGDNGIPGVEACLDACSVDQRPQRYSRVERCVAVACPDSDECSGQAYEVPPAGSAGVVTGAGDGGGDLPDCSFDPDLKFDRDEEVLQLENADENVCLRIERRNEGKGKLANTRWTLLDVRLGLPDNVAHVDDEANLCWVSTHHNFFDFAHVWTGERHHDLEMVELGHGGDLQYVLHSFEQGPLETNQCREWPDGDNPTGWVEMFPFNP